MHVLSKTNHAQSFTYPPHGGRMSSILELILHHVEHNPDYPVFQYADVRRSLHRITWGQIASALQSVVDFVKDSLHDVASAPPEPYIIGIVANLDSITYFCLIVGIKLAGCVPFPISLRNSEEGVAHLLSKTKCKALFRSKDRLTQDLCFTSLQILDCDKLPDFVVPTLASLMEPKGNPVLLKLPNNARSENLCIIYHSSGTTGHPKAVYLSHEAIYKWGVGLAYRDSGIDTTDEMVSIHGLPFYHGMVYCLMLSCMMSGTVATVFDPTQELAIPSPESVLEAAVASKSNMMFTLPSFLEAWSKNQETLQALRSFTSIMFAGGPISLEVGGKLFQAGVPLSPMYGTTETGPLAVFLRVGLQSVGWNWLKTRPGLDLAFVSVEDGLYKLIIKDNELKKLAVYNTTVDGVPAYDTNDIVERHSADPTLWRVRSRQDLLIVHSSGEKTNPIPIEEHLRQNERIAAAVMFGREQLLAGVIILPAVGYTVDTTDQTKVKEYRDMIWGTVREANAKAPGHSRIFKEMIVIAESNRPFEYTDKGFPKRHSVLNEYRDDILKLYNDMASDTVYGDYDLSSDACTFDLAMIKHLVSCVVSSTLSQTVGEDDNIFSFGADSLSAMSIRNTLLRVLSKKLPSSSRNEMAHTILSPDLVFLHPTINSISLILSQLPIWSEIEDSPVAERKEDTTTDRDHSLPIWSLPVDDARAPSGMVKYKEGSGEIPLICLPDVGGSAGVFKRFQELHECAVWSVDITQVPATTFASIHDLVSFYLRQIKAERPVGPYRFASFSGSSMVLLCLVRLLEQSGDEVVQVSFLDHFPNCYIYGVSDPFTFNPNTSTADLDAFVNNNFKQIQMMVSVSIEHTDAASEMATTNTWFADSLAALLNNRPIHPIMEETTKRMTNTIAITIKFLFGNEFRSNGEWSRELYDSWLKSMKVVPTVYLATEGIAAFYENPEKEFVTGLGVKEAYPSARVVVIPGTHTDVLNNKVVIDDLDKDFL